MSALADAIQRALESAVAQGPTWMLASVTAVGTGVVTISTATGPIADVRHLKSYAPTVGDTVMATRNATGSWLVVDALA